MMTWIILGLGLAVAIAATAGALRRPPVALDLGSEGRRLLGPVARRSRLATFAHRRLDRTNPGGWS